MSTIKFDPNFVSETELMRNFDALVEYLRPELAARAHAKVMQLDMDRLAQMNFAYTALQRMTQGTDAVVKYDLNKPYMLVGSVRVRTRVLEFDDPELFIEVAKISDGVDIETFINGEVELSFTFRNFAKPVHSEEGK